MASSSNKHSRISMSDVVRERKTSKSKSCKSSKKYIKISKSLYKTTNPTEKVIHYRTRQSSESSNRSRTPDGNFKRKSVPTYRRIKRPKTISSGSESDTNKESSNTIHVSSMVPTLILNRLDETNPDYLSYLQRIANSKNCTKTFTSKPSTQNTTTSDNIPEKNTKSLNNKNKKNPISKNIKSSANKTEKSPVPFTERQTSSNKSSELTVKIPEKKKTRPLKLRRDDYLVNSIHKENDPVSPDTKTESNNNLQESSTNVTKNEENKFTNETDFSEEELDFSSDTEGYDTDSTVTSHDITRDSCNSFVTDKSWKTYESEDSTSIKKKLILSRPLSTSSASLNSTGSIENKKKKHFKSIDKHLTAVDDALKVDDFVQRYTSLDIDYAHFSVSDDFETPNPQCNYNRFNRCNSLQITSSDFTCNKNQDVKKHVWRFSSPAKRPPKCPTPLENKEFKVPMLPKRMIVKNPVHTPGFSAVDKEDTISLYAETICTLPFEESKCVVQTEKNVEVYDWIRKCSSEADLDVKRIELNPISPQKNYIGETTAYNNIFQYICPKILSFGVCQRVKNCSHLHDLPCNWESIVESMPANEISSLYDDLKNKKYLFVYKKIFNYVTSTLGRAKDLNKLTRLSEDVMVLNMDTDCTPFIIGIVQAIENSEITFQSAIDLVYKGANLNQEKKNTLADILLYVIVDHESPLEDNWMNVQMLVKNRSNLDPGFVQDILSNALKEPVNENICVKIYRDILLKIPDTHLRHIFHTVIDKYVKLLENINMKEEASCLYNRWKIQNDLNSDSSSDKRIDSSQNITNLPIVESNQSELDNIKRIRQDQFPNQFRKPIQTVPNQNQFEFQRSVSEPAQSSYQTHQSEYVPVPPETFHCQLDIPAYPNTVSPLFSNPPFLPQIRPNYFPNSPVRPDVYQKYQRPSFPNDVRNWRSSSIPNRKFRQNYRPTYPNQDRRKYNQNPPNYQVLNPVHTDKQNPSGPIDLKKIPRENYGSEHTMLRNTENKSYFTQEYVPQNQMTRPGTSQKSNIIVKNPIDGVSKTIEVYRHTIPNDVQCENEIRFSVDSDYEKRPELNGRSNDMDGTNHVETVQNAIYTPTPISKLKSPIGNNQTNYEFSNFQNKTEHNDFSRHEIEQAFSSENASNIFNLIFKHKNHNIDQFLSIAIDVLLNQTHNLPTFFNSLSEKLRICFNMDSDTKHVIMTIGMNIMMSEVEQKCWNDATKILRLIDQYPNKELCKIYHGEFSVGKKILALCHVMIHSESSVELDRAWRSIKDGKFHQTYENWNYDSVETDRKYRDRVVDDYFNIMNKKNHIVLDILTSLVEQQHNDIDVSKYVDNAIILAINNNCTATRLLNLHFTYSDWVNHVQDTTFRALTIKMVKEKWLNPICFDLYEKGVLMDIYPQYLGNESMIILNSNLCAEEIQVIIESFLIKREQYKLETPIKIQARQVMKFTRNIHLIRPKPYFDIPSDLKTMITRIVNTLQNGPLKFPNIEIDDSSHSVIVPVETINHCVNELKLLSKLKRK